MNAKAHPQPGTDALRAVSLLMEDCRDERSIPELKPQMEKSGFDLVRLRKNVTAAIQEAKGLVELAQARTKRESMLGKAKQLLQMLPKIPDPRAAIREYIENAERLHPQFAVQFRGKLEGTSDSELESLLEDMALAEMLDDDDTTDSK